MFADTRDPVYQAILARIEAAADKHRQERRFDMPGFQPNVYYLRMMQSYGTLPAEWNPGETVDFRAVERAYWDSFIWDGAKR